MGELVADFIVLLILVVVTWLAQALWARSEVRTALDALGQRRTFPPHGEFTFDVIRGERQVLGGTESFIRSISWAGGEKRKGGQIEAFVWVDDEGIALEKKHWEGRAERMRHSFLERTQGTADKWRNIFAGLLGIFGAVLLVSPALPAGQTRLPAEAYILVMLALVLGAQAVAYTGWAAAGLPKMLLNVDAETAFIQETTYAAKSVARLRLGLLLGGLSASALILAAASLL
ncbi:hypothetical protein [Ornithinimicrobium cerasi]|uniref:Uncharacterized protein n=1 Tax=Ornithinimicrobium cerasi TaxID=2248773 RepID=A0A285VD53_9MICO|nr:hypothetical protein [Ornithinimicrobium cerasi]SOC51877.1 hypothetical protein SAMN05421879_101339 [Ornithinimicrobium cerasi]